MNKIKILLIIVGLIFLYNMMSGGVVENLGSDFFHRGKLADIHQHIQKQVAEARQRYGMNKKEGFATLEEMPTEYKPELKKRMKDIPKEKYDPSRYVISEYSFKAMKPSEDKELDQVQVGDLEDASFTKPVDYSADKPLAEYLEVDSYNSGSGDMSELNKAFAMLNKDNYFQSLKALSVRGGNVHVYPTKKCNPSGKGDIVGFEGY